MRKTFLILALLAATIARAQNNVVVTVTAEMGGTYAGGALKATNIVPGGNASTSLAFFFNSSGTVSAGLPSNGTWLFDFCNSSNICFSAQVQLPGANSFDATTIFTAAAASAGSGVSSVSCVSGCTVATPTTTPAITVTSAGGTVTSFSTTGTPCLAPLFSCSVATPTSTPALTFSLSSAAQNSVFAGPASGGAAAPSFQLAPTFSAANLTNFPSTLALTTNPLSQFASTTSAQFAGVISDETGTGSVVFSISPTLVTPALGTPSALVLTNATALPCGALPALTGDVTSAGATCTISVVNVNGAVIPTSAVVLGSNASKQIVAATTTGSGAAVLATSPTLVTPALGTPSAIVLTNATGLPCGALPALTGDTTTSAASCATTTAKINGTAFPASATVIGSNSSSQPIAATTTGTGTTVVLATSPTLVTPALGTPSALVLTNATGLPVAGGGTGLATLTSNVIYKGNGTSPMSVSSMTDNGTSVTSSDTGGYVAPVFQANGTTAGFFDFPQGTTSAAVSPCSTATSICEQAPTAVTSYLVNKPGIAANGVETNNVASAVDTQGFSGDANHSTTVTISSATSVSSTSLCSTTNCPAGTYQINGYLDVTTACTTTGGYFVSIIYTDDAGSKTVVMPLIGTGVTASLLTATGISSSLALSSTSNFAQGDLFIRSTGAASINYSTTASACATGGPAAGKLYLSVVPVQ